METEKLYYADAFCKTFTASVLTCTPGKDGFLVTLDRTAFYPEGGGQPADHGTLGPAAVTDVHEKDGVIFHTCDRALAPGAAVEGTVDWDRRFDHMQQHSGEHILSGILCRRYRCDNVGFHLGADTVTIDYNVPLTWEQVLAAEAEANAVIWADRPAEITYPSPEELEALDYRSKKELTGQVRIVTFPEADCCACCGTHVLRAGQVGLVKVLSCQKFHQGVRLEILCGSRAVTYLSNVYEQARTAGQQLSVKPVELSIAVERLTAELTAVKARQAELEGRLIAGTAARYAGAGDVLLVEPPMQPDAARRLADAVARSCKGLAAVFAGAEDRYVYALVQSQGQDISPLVKSLNGSLHGRGGGRSGFAQGSVQASETEIRAFFHDQKEEPSCAT